MRFFQGMWAALACAVLGTASAGATARSISPENYRAIPECNVFRLKPRAAAPVVAPRPPSLPRLVLTGITTILGDKRALLKRYPADARPNDFSREESFILAEGQRESTVQILRIDEQAGLVEAINDGAPVVLTFEKDGSRLPATPAPAALGTNDSGPPAMVSSNLPAGSPDNPWSRHRGSRWPGTGSDTGGNVSAANSGPPLNAEEERVLREAERQLNPSPADPVAPATPRMPPLRTPFGLPPGR